MHASQPSESEDLSRATMLLGYRLWPAILVTCLTGAGFAGLKFVLINEIALRFDPHHPPPLPFHWMETVLARCLATDSLREAVSQGLAAILTLGVLIGYAVNAPLAGAWRVCWLFLLSCLGVAVGTVATLVWNVWPVAFLVGIAYGAACAARGKVVPLLSTATGRGGTQVSGFMNASLMIGLLGGTVLGTVLGEQVHPWGGCSAQVLRHLVLFSFMAVATALSLLVRPPEPPRVPFGVGVRALAQGTATMLTQHWPLLAGGGLAWGIASAASLAVYVDTIDPHRLGLHPTTASYMAIFAAIGAILGNLASHYWSRRRHVIGALTVLAALLAVYPHVVHHWYMAAAMMVTIGVFFAAPTNVLDARLLVLAGREGLAGRGATVMSLVHNVFIFLVGSGLAIPLFLGAMSPTTQFTVLACAALATGLVVTQARLHDRRPGDPPLPGPTAQVIAAAPTGVAD